MPRTAFSVTVWRRPGSIARLPVSCATFDFAHDVSAPAQAAATRRRIYRDAVGNDPGPNITPPRMTGGGWAVYSEDVNMGPEGLASSGISRFPASQKPRRRVLAALMTAARRSIRHTEI